MEFYRQFSSTVTMLVKNVETCRDTGRSWIIGSSYTTKYNKTVN